MLWNDKRPGAGLTEHSTGQPSGWAGPAPAAAQLPAWGSSPARTMAPAEYHQQGMATQGLQSRGATIQHQLGQWGGAHPMSYSGSIPHYPSAPPTTPMAPAARRGGVRGLFRG